MARAGASSGVLRTPSAMLRWTFRRIDRHADASMLPADHHRTGGEARLVLRHARAEVDHAQAELRRALRHFQNEDQAVEYFA